MIEIEKPNIATVTLSEDGRSGKFVVEPLERGYGITLGNSLRRVLLSSLPGVAVTSIKVDGVLHEFSTVPGMTEDMTEFVLNVKGIVAKLHTSAPKTVILDVTGPREVVAGDIKQDSDIEILNADHHLATLSEGGHLFVELTFECGRGYVSQERNKLIHAEAYGPNVTAPIGLIYTDSIYTPVYNVSYNVENTRVGSNIADYDKLKYWMPVDWYNGGMEHTTLHLLYSRFWHKFLYDIGVVPTKEPYAKRTSHGMILGEGGEKMSKSRGNVVNPNDIVAQYGADTMRLHIMFIGDFEKAVSWSNEAVKGSKRFLDRCFNLQDIATGEEAISAKNESIVHKTIKKVSQDIDELKMNTAIAAMMTMVNEFYANGCSKGDVRALCLLLSPFAPHMVEEMWENMGFAAKEGKMAMQMPWPEYDEAKTVDATREMAVQVNGKLKSTITVPSDSEDSVVIDAACADDKVKRLMEGKQLVKTIVVKNKLINLIIK